MLYDLTFGQFLVGLVSLIMIITFFMMSSRIKDILKILEFFKDREFKNDPDYWCDLKCEKCDKDFRIAKSYNKPTVNCPHCKAINKVPA